MIGRIKLLKTGCVCVGGTHTVDYNEEEERRGREEEER